MTKRSNIAPKTQSCTRAQCWKLLKRGVPSAKMTKHADLGLKTLFWRNSCTLLKIVKTGAPSAKITNRADLGLNSLLGNLNRWFIWYGWAIWTGWLIWYDWVIRNGWSFDLVSLFDMIGLFEPVGSFDMVWKWQNVFISGWVRCFVQTRAVCSKSLKSGAHSPKMTKRADLGQNTSVLFKFGHFAGNRKKVVCPVPKWQKVLISGWKSCYLETRELCRKSLKMVHPVRKWQNILNSRWKRCFVQTRALCWKTPKRGAPSAKMTKRSDLGQKTDLQKVVHFAKNA